MSRPVGGIDGAPGDVGQPPDGGGEARRPDDLGVVGLGPGDEVDHERAHLVGEDAVRRPPSVSMKTPSVVARPVSCSSSRAFLIDGLDGSAQLIGSLSMRVPPSTTRPTTGSATASDDERHQRATRAGCRAAAPCARPSRRSAPWSSAGDARGRR